MTSNIQIANTIRRAYRDYMEDPSFAQANYTLETADKNEEFVTDAETAKLIGFIQRMVPSDYGDLYSIYSDAIDYITERIDSSNEPEQETLDNTTELLTIIASMQTVVGRSLVFRHFMLEGMKGNISVPTLSEMMGRVSYPEHERLVIYSPFGYLRMLENKPLPAHSNMSKVAIKKYLNNRYAETSKQVQGFIAEAPNDFKTVTHFVRENIDEVPPTKNNFSLDLTLAEYKF